MADTKISSLTTHTSPISADILPIIDTVNNITKKITRSKLMTSVSESIVVAASNSLDTSGADYVCDGINDDVEINAAFTALGATAGKVKLKEGTYNLGNSITINQYQWLHGSGKGTILRANNSLNKDLIVNPKGTSMRYIQISDFKIDGNRGNNTSGHAINLDGSRNGIITNIWFRDIKQRCIYLHGSSQLGWYNYIYTNEIDNCSDGIYVNGNTEHSLIYNNLITFVDGKGIYCDTDSDYIYANKIDHCGGVSIHVEFGAGIWQIIGNSIDRPQDHAIVARRAPNTIIADNFFGECAAGKALICNGQFNDGNGSNKLIVFGNRMNNTGGAGSYGIREIDPSDSCIYTNNTITGNTTAISINASSTNLIVRNNIGFATESSGVATVANGTTSIAVTHGLAKTPSAKDISVTPTNNMGNATKFWISTFTSTQFTINVNTDPGATTATFAWAAAIL